MRPSQIRQSQSLKVTNIGCVCSHSNREHDCQPRNVGFSLQYQDLLATMDEKHPSPPTWSACPQISAEISSELGLAMESTRRGGSTIIWLLHNSTNFPQKTSHLDSIWMYKKKEKSRKQHGDTGWSSHLEQESLLGSAGVEDICMAAFSLMSTWYWKLMMEKTKWNGNRNQCRSSLVGLFCAATHCKCSNSNCRVAKQIKQCSRKLIRQKYCEESTAK